MSTDHQFTVTVHWTGDRGEGTRGYRVYGRDHVIEVAGKPDLLGSAVPEFRGDADRHNPEDLFVAALSSCHMLWYLHLCADAGVVVTAYQDTAQGVLVLDRDRGGQFARVILYPQVTITPDSDAKTARALHAAAHMRCFIANSVSCPVRHEPVIRVETG